MTRPKVDTSKYIGQIIAAAVVVPDLYDKELQDSYGANTPEELLKEMIDNPTEYNEFTVFVQGYNGFDVSLNDKIDEVKNE